MPPFLHGKYFKLGIPFVIGSEIIFKKYNYKLIFRYVVLLRNTSINLMGQRKNVWVVQIIHVPQVNSMGIRRNVQLRANGGFQLLDLNITELKSHMTC